MKGRGVDARDAVGQELEDANELPVVRPQVMAPVPDAVRPVDSEETRARGDRRQGCQALWDT